MFNVVLALPNIGGALCPPTAEIRRGKEERRKKKPQGKNIMD